jgi:hypothetical protein
MGLHKTKKLLHSKVNSHITEETVYKKGENLCQLYMLQGINKQNTQETPKKTNPAKNQQPIL